MYKFGEGVEADGVRGFLLNEQAITLGNSEAIESRDRLRSMLSEEELAAVKEHLSAQSAEKMNE